MKAIFHDASASFGGSGEKIADDQHQDAHAD